MGVGIGGRRRLAENSHQVNGGVAAFRGGGDGLWVGVVDDAGFFRGGGLAESLDLRGGTARADHGAG